MTVAKEIRTKIQSIKSTQKITRAMEMVSASKMRKAQDRMMISRPYVYGIRQLVSRVASSHSEYKHPYFKIREVKRVGFIIVSTDRGLCGSLNSNLLKMAINAIKQYSDQAIEIDLCLIGSKANQFFKRLGSNVIAQITHLGDAPKLSDLIGIVKVALDNYNDDKLSHLFVVHNEFINTMSQLPRVLPLLPILVSEEAELKHHWDYIYEPSAKELLDLLLIRYIESQVYQAVIENIACEQAARMVAMKNATENAISLIDELQLIYNKARQTAITTELAEIVAGAEAI